jgi:hypothetical protein
MGSNVRIDIAMGLRRTPPPRSRLSCAMRRARDSAS